MYHLNSTKTELLLFVLSSLSTDSNDFDSSRGGCVVESFGTCTHEVLNFQKGDKKSEKISISSIIPLILSFKNGFKLSVYAFQSKLSSVSQRTDSRINFHFRNASLVSDIKSKARS